MTLILRFTIILFATKKKKKPCWNVEMCILKPWNTVYFMSIFFSPKSPKNNGFHNYFVCFFRIVLSFILVTFCRSGTPWFSRNQSKTKSPPSTRTIWIGRHGQFQKRTFNVIIVLYFKSEKKNCFYKTYPGPVLTSILIMT